MPVEPIVGPENIRHRLPSGQAYIRIVSKGRVIYCHPTAGQSYGKGRTRWEDKREKNATLRGGNKWAMWKDKDEWETVKWMATTKTSQSSLNKLLKTERVSCLPIAGAHILSYYLVPRRKVLLLDSKEVV